MKRIFAPALFFFCAVALWGNENPTTGEKAPSPTITISLEKTDSLIDGFQKEMDDAAEDWFVANNDTAKEAKENYEKFKNEYKPPLNDFKEKITGSEGAAYEKTPAPSGSETAQLVLLIIILLLCALACLLLAKATRRPRHEQKPTANQQPATSKDTETSLSRIAEQLSLLQDTLDELKSKVEQKAPRKEQAQRKDPPIPHPKVPKKPDIPAKGGLHLYAELNADSNGTILYKVSPQRGPSSLYEIILKNENDTKGDFQVLTDSNKKGSALQNRSTFLAACNITGNDIATQIENVLPGQAERQADGTWRVLRKAQILLR